MPILNVNSKTNTVIDSPDPSEWYVENVERAPVVYTYHVDAPAIKEMVLVKEYPNGGKDYRENIISPEQGHFTVTYENGEAFPYPVDIPKYASKDAPISDIVDIAYLKPLTEEEKFQREQENTAEQEKAEAQTKFLEHGPSQLNDVQTAQDDMILLLADIVGGAV